MQNPSSPLKPGVLAHTHCAIYSPFITTSRKLKPVGRMGRNDFSLINYTFAQSTNVLPSPDKNQTPWRATYLKLLVGLNHQYLGCGKVIPPAEHTTLPAFLQPVPLSFTLTPSSRWFGWFASSRGSTHGPGKHVLWQAVTTEKPTHR